MLVEKVEVYRDQGEARVLLRTRLELLKHGLKKPRKEISPRLLHVLELCWAFKLALNLEIQIVIEPVEGIPAKYLPLGELSHDPLLFKLNIPGLASAPHHSRRVLVFIEAESVLLSST
jgi:hypothetical protein